MCLHVPVAPMHIGGCSGHRHDRPADGGLPLKIWLITVGEPLPLPGATDRPWRTGLLAEELGRRDHDVLWWTSAVDHFSKQTLVAGEPRIQVKPGVTLQFLAGRLYKRNISIARLRNHAELAARFRARVRDEPVPDLIVCSYPTIELAREAVSYGKAHGVPVVLDVRDLWPDIFLDVLPAWARGPGRFLAGSLFRDARMALGGSTALTAVSPGYLRWALGNARRQQHENDRCHPLGYRPTPWTSADNACLNERLGQCGADMSRMVVTFVGTFGRTYDLSTVISAARALHRDDAAAIQFVLCGAGERAEQWKQEARGLENVAFPGWLPATELACLLDRSALGLAAYAAMAPQGIPNKVIEYMSAGLPVLCSLPGESRALIEQHGCGVYYPAGDPHALVRELVALSSSPDKRAAMGEASRSLFKARYSSSTVYREMADHLESLASMTAQQRHVHQ